jgi:hypothetical protein
MELDGLEKRLATEHQLDAEAIGRVRRLMERLPGVELGISLTGTTPAFPEVTGSVVRNGKVKAVSSHRAPKPAAVNGKGHGPGSSKTASVAREWVAGLRSGAEFSIQELTAKVASMAGERAEVVKTRMYAWLGNQGPAIGVEKLPAKGMYKKTGVKNGVASKPPEGSVATATDAPGETWREKMERLKKLQEEAGSPE